MWKRSWQQPDWHEPFIGQWIESRMLNSSTMSESLLSWICSELILIKMALDWISSFLSQIDLSFNESMNIFIVLEMIGFIIKPKALLVTWLVYSIFSFARGKKWQLSTISHMINLLIGCAVVRISSRRNSPANIRK